MKDFWIKFIFINLYDYSSVTVDENTVTTVLYNSEWAPGNYRYREPSLLTGNSDDKWAPMTSVTGTSYDSQYYTNAGSFNSVMEFGAKLQSDYDKMVQKVVTSGGFYIGRYESSLVNDKTRVVAGATSMTASESTSSMWYGLYARQKNFSVDNGLTSVVSDMIWGSQYDAMMNWMAKNGKDIITGQVRQVNVRAFIHIVMPGILVQDQRYISIRKFLK